MVVRRQTRYEANSELDDLIGGDNNINSNGGILRRVPSADSSVGANSATATLNLDHLTNRKVQVSVVTAVVRPKSKFYKTYYGRTVSCTDYCCSHLSMLCYYYPCSCGCLLVTVILAIMVLLASLMLNITNPVQQYGTMPHDHSNIQSVYDLSMGAIDHWCLGGGDTRCACEDPLTPTSRVEHASWTEAFVANRKLLKRFKDPAENAKLDVAFLGESIVEAIDGRWMGRRDRSTGLSNLERIFNQHFRKAEGAKVEGVALGIAGDTAPNVLWRLLHGEMPDYFTPKVWWLSLGNNDLGRMECSEEVVVIGILRVVEEILVRRPGARVVINSMFPMTVLRGGLYPVISDFEDSFSRQGNSRSLAVAASTAKLYDDDFFEQNERDYRRFLRLRQRAEVQVSPSHQTEEKMAKATEKEEELRNKQAAKEKKNRGEPTQRNPVMTDRAKVRKYELGASLMRKSAKPLWTSIRAINRELRKFADKHDRVIFFDATDLFAEKVGKSYTLLTDQISIRGHPTERGFSVWEDEIVKKLEQILVTMKRDQPELFKDAPALNVADEKTKGKETSKIDDEVARQLDDDLDMSILRPNDDGFGPGGDDEDKGMQSSGSNDDDDDNDTAEGGDLRVEVGVNGNYDGTKHSQAEDGDARPGNTDDV